MEIDPKYMTEDGLQANMFSEAFSDLAAKAVEFATIVKDQSRCCIFLVGGSSAVWNVNVEFDRIAHAIIKEIESIGVPVISGVPIYRRMTESQGKFDEWHFRLNENNAYILTDAMVSSSKLCCIVDAFKSTHCLEVLAQSELFDAPDDREVDSFLEPLEYNGTRGHFPGGR